MRRNEFKKFIADGLEEAKQDAQLESIWAELWAAEGNEHAPSK
jgi:hypothetical protein